MVNMTKLRLHNTTPLIFTVNLSEQDDRLDCAWFNPIAKDQIDTLRKTKRADRTLIKLSSVSDVNGGKRLPEGTVVIESEANTIPYVRARDVKNLKVNVDNAIRISKAIHKEIQNYQLKKSDITITIVGVNIGDVGILETDVEVCDFTENVARVRINNDLILPKFILYYLDSILTEIQTEKYKVGSLQDKLSLGSCRQIEIYVPQTENSYNIREQQKIIDEVDKLFEKSALQIRERLSLIKRARSVVDKKLGIIIPKLESNKPFIQKLSDDESGRLDALFNNPFREKLIETLKKHPYKTLRAITKPEKNENIPPSDFYRLVDLEQVDELTGKITHAKDVGDLGSEKVLLKENCILIAKLQAEKGKVAIVSSEFDNAVGSGELIQLRLNSSEVSLEYLWAVLRSDYVLKQWEYVLSGSSRMRIGTTDLANTIIPIPKKEIQDEIVSEINELIDESEVVFSEAKQSRQKAKDRFIELLVGR